MAIFVVLLVHGPNVGIRCHPARTLYNISSLSITEEIGSPGFDTSWVYIPTLAEQWKILVSE
jgi:hypothetical protein